MSILANTITALTMQTDTYLFVLNALIGVLEGWLLKRFFKGGRHAIAWMIAANYFSAWVGWYIFRWFVESRLDTALGPRPIERVNHVILMLGCIAFALTVLLEIGFVYVAIDRPQRSLTRTLLGTLCVNAISYALICLWFFSTPFTSYVDAQVTSLSDLGPLPHGTLFWVDPSGDVIARNCAGSGPDRRVGKVVIDDYASPYQLRLTRATDANRVGLSVIYSHHSYPGQPTTTEDVPDYDVLLTDAGDARALPADYWEQSQVLLKNILDLRPPDHRQTLVQFDRYRCFLRTDVPGGPRTSLRVGFAGFQWSTEQPTVLPDDKIVFEWEEQIVLFDPHARKIAFVAHGTCPAFIPDVN